MNAPFLPPADTSTTNCERFRSAPVSNPPPSH